MMIMKERFKDQSLELRWLHRSALMVSAASFVFVMGLAIFYSRDPFATGSSRRVKSIVGSSGRSGASSTKTSEGHPTPDSTPLTPPSGFTPLPYVNLVVFACVLAASGLQILGLIFVSRALSSGSSTAANTSGASLTPPPNKISSPPWNLQWLYALLTLGTWVCSYASTSAWFTMMVLAAQFGVYSTRVLTLHRVLGRVDAAPKRAFG